MRYRYRSEDELKDSGVEWLGKIPKDWEVKKIKHLFELKKDKSDEENPTVLSLTQKGLRIRDVSNNEGQLASTYVGYTKIEKNDFILNPMDLISGYTDKAEIEGVISPAYTTFRSKNKVNINHDYYKRYFQMHYHHNFLFPWGEGVSFEHRWTLKNEVFLNLPVITNALEEQEKIANFLDEKTSQFDLIISKKEKLIERLEEAKKSLISEVVTGKVKVVKTDAGYELMKKSSEEMKDSGVEWLGEIPKDWEYGQLKYLCSYITDGAHISPETENGVYPFLSVKDLKNGHLDFKNCLLTSSNNYEYLKRNSCNPKLGDVLISKDGTIGKTVTIEYDKNFVVASSLVILRPKKFLQSKYFEYILNSKSVQEQINSFVKGAALPRISITHLKEILLPFTRDIIEQGDIVDYLSIELNRIDSILYKINLQIEKIKEAKQSLISEVVTGKIEIL